MAAQEDEENYWPGYVDALTTMTMVLTFIMLVLGLAVFSLSQNVSKGMLESIAKAMKLPADLPQDLSSEEITRILIERVERQDAAMLAAQSAFDALNAGLAERQARGAGSRMLAAGPMTPAGTGEQAPGGISIEKRIESREEAALAGTAAAIALTTGPAQFRLVYKPRATGLDDDAKTALGQALTAEGPLRTALMVEIVAGVDATSPAVSDGNRVAYYRALTVRSQLLAAGVEAERIKVRLDGRLSGDEIVIAATPGSAPAR